MIIAISGKIASGKDAVGKIWRYIQTQGVNPDTPSTIDKYSLEDWMENKQGCNSLSNLEIKKFADKPKDMVCMILGCTRAQLDDREYQETELGEEWCTWSIATELGRVISINGNGFLFKSEQEALSHMSVGDVHFKVVKEYMTPRKFMQKFFTEGGRLSVHNDVWANTLMREYRERKPSKGVTYDYRNTECIDCGKPFSGDKRQFICNDCHDTHDWFPKWIITDLRFTNELEAVTRRGGITIRINRNNGTRAVDIHNHISETALDNAEFDYVIENDGTLEELVEKVRVIYKLVNK
jgi:hypothetical protein